MSKTHATTSKSLETGQEGFAEILAQISTWRDETNTIQWDQVIEQYPQFADQLRQVRPAFDGIMILDGSSNQDVFDPSRHDEFKATRSLGDFKILREIGRGGMGIVYEAQQLSINRRVALKVLPLAALIDSRALQRFKNEVSAIATLDHPNIVSVYSIGEERAIHFFAMQLVKGPSMAMIIDRLKKDSLVKRAISADSFNQVITCLYERPNDISGVSSEGNHSSDRPGAQPAEVDTRVQANSNTARLDKSYVENAVRMIIQAARALQHAHYHEVIHRDIKPGNLLLDKSGTLIVSDFGLARIQSGPGVTMTGDFLGTLRYMSPEQVMANRIPIDHRTDIYSLGATLYELLALEPMLQGDDRAELIRKISFDDPKPLCKTIPADLQTIVLKATRKDLKERYFSAQELGDDLQRFLDCMPIIAKRPTIVQRASKWTQRHPAMILSTIIVLILATILLSVSAWMVSSKQEETSRALVVANDNLNLALDALDELMVQSVAKRLQDSPHVSIADQEFLESGFAWYMDFAESNRGVAGAQFATAKALGRAGEIQMAISHRQYAARDEQSIRKAIGSFEEAISLLDELLLAGSDAAQYVRLLSYYHGELAKCLAEKSPVIAQVHFDRSIEIIERLDMTPMSHQVILGENLLASAQYKIRNENSIDRFGEASQLIERSLSVFANLLEEEPSNPWIRCSYANGYFCLGAYYFRLNEFAKAAEQFRLAIEIFEQLPATITEPVPEGYNTLRYATYIIESNRRIHDCYDHLGQILIRSNKPKLANEIYRRARDFWDQRCAADPKNAVYLNRYAWFLITCPIADIRDPESAIELSLRGVAVATEFGTVWDTLAAAYCYAGHWDEVRFPAEKSLEFEEGGAPFGLVYLALLELHLGNQQLASQMLSEAIDELNDKNATHLDLYRLTYEAAMTMELDPSNMTCGTYLFYLDR